MPAFSSTIVKSIMPLISADWLIYLQKNCSYLFNFGLHHGDLASSFICGTKIEDISAQEIFRQSGLIHLMVVSGGHLHFLIFIFTSIISTAISPLYRKHILINAILIFSLIFYCLCTGFQPPIVRGLMVLLIKWLQTNLRLGWNQNKIQGFAGLTCLIFFPDWILSFSFYLSWLAGLSLSFNLPEKDEHKIWRALKNALFVQGFVSFAFLNFSMTAIVMNFLFAAILAVILIPASIAAAVIPATSNLVDALWSYLLALIQKLSAALNWIFHSNIINNFPELSEIRWISLWLLIAVMHALIELFSKIRFQNSYV